MTLGYDKPLYVLPFDHRASFSREMFGWEGELSYKGAPGEENVRKLVDELLLERP